MIKNIKILKRKFIRYWLGEVTISKYYIECLDKKNRLYTISIIPSRYRKATWFSDVDVNSIFEIISKLETHPKQFYFRLEHGEGVFQEYTFNKHQQKILLKELKTIIKTEEFYVEDKDY